MIEQTTVNSATQSNDLSEDRSMKMLEYAVSLVAILAAVLLAFASH
jgi:hypothetical protein